MPADDRVSGGHDSTPFESRRPAWQAQANCHPDVIPHVWQEYGNHPVDLFYPPPNTSRLTQDRLEAIEAVCSACPVREECVAWSTQHEDHGWWAGIGPEIRRHFRQELGTQLERPEVDPETKRIIGTWLPPAHGTQARYAQHRREGSQPCQLCIEGPLRPPAAGSGSPLGSHQGQGDSIRPPQAPSDQPPG